MPGMGFARNMHLMSAIFVAVVDIKLIKVVIHVAQFQKSMSEDRKVTSEQPRVLSAVPQRREGGSSFLTHQSHSPRGTTLNSRLFPCRPSHFSLPLLAICW